MPDKLKIVALGSGNLAHHLVPALRDIDCHITQVYSRDISRAKSLAHLVEADAIDDITHLDTEADVYIIMIKDDALESFVDQLPCFNASQTLAHTAGAKAIDILGMRAINYGSFYPLQTFKKNQAMDMSKVPFFINGNNATATANLRIIARMISSKVEVYSDYERMKYHLAAVFVNNFNNHLACLTQNFLESNGLKFEHLKAIIKTGNEKILQMQACQSQTGPAVREDHLLMEKHLEIIKDDKQLSDIYKIISKSIIDQHRKEKA